MGNCNVGHFFRKNSIDSKTGLSKGGCMSKNVKKEIVLWAGDEGVKIDRFGNILTVKRNDSRDYDWAERDLVALYQSVLRELGFSVEVWESEISGIKSMGKKYRVTHTIRGDRHSLLPHYYKSFGYEYMK